MIHCTSVQTPTGISFLRVWIFETADQALQNITQLRLVAAHQHSIFKRILTFLADFLKIFTQYDELFLA